ETCAPLLKDGLGRLRRPTPPSPHEDPSEMDEFVTVATYDRVTDAHIALGRLLAEGIEAQLFDDNMVQMDWLYSIALGGIKLRVARSDAKAARAVLEMDYSAVLDEAERDGTND
ncbi:MAG TPA: hypothetical protein VGS99_03465, partial [Gammaproteobacteria bacterium]|nr:hypothetical protein [Gammaproteobacteria bacterium]